MDWAHARQVGTIRLFSVNLQPLCRSALHSPKPIRTCVLANSWFSSHLCRFLVCPDKSQKLSQVAYLWRNCNLPSALHHRFSSIVGRWRIDLYRFRIPLLERKIYICPDLDRCLDWFPIVYRAMFQVSWSRVVWCYPEHLFRPIPFNRHLSFQNSRQKAQNLYRHKQWCRKQCASHLFHHRWSLLGNNSLEWAPRSNCLQNSASQQS